MVYLYESHVDGLYINEDCLNFEDLYCEECGDSDNLLGSFETLKEFWDLVKDECDINGSGGLSLSYLYPIIVEEFGLPYEVTYENEYTMESGYCCNSEKQILKNIEEALKKDYHAKED